MIELHYKINEYSNYAEILQVDNNYETCMFFFAGFNEDASKYIFLFKNFLENSIIKNFLKLKIIIPFLPIYSNKEYPIYWISNPERFPHIYAWYNAEKYGDNKFRMLPNFKKNDEIVNLINQELKIVKSSENIIYVGFSMGGRYLLEILELTKIKTKFNVTFKSGIILYENKNKNETERSNFIKNKFYLYYSLNDKIVPFTKFSQSYSCLKENGIENIKVKIDNGWKHVVDEKCLKHLESIFSEEYKYKYKNKNEDNVMTPKF